MSTKLEAVADLLYGRMYADDHSRRPVPGWTHVAYEFPGVVVVGTDAGGVYVAGTANETITIDVYPTVEAYINGQPSETIDTGELSSEIDSEAIAAAVLDGIVTYEGDAAADAVWALQHGEGQ